jgi:arginase
VDHDWQILATPLDSAGAGEGEERAPRALLEGGVARVSANAPIWLDTCIADPVRDEESGVIGVAALRRATEVIAHAVAGVLAAGGRPLVLGGDCAVVPGILGGVRRAGLDPGVFYLDGHPDACDGATSPTGEAADMTLSVLTGGGPHELEPAHAPTPVISAERIVLAGFRGDVPAEIRLRDGSLVTEVSRLPRALRRYDAEALRALGPSRMVTQALHELGAPGRPVWLHLDVDILDEAEMPAVSYPQPRGPTVAELTELLERLAAGAGLAGAHVTCFNPDLDPDGRALATVVELIGRFT